MSIRFFYGYKIVWAGFFIQAVTIGTLVSYGVFFKEFQTEFGWSRALISGASSVNFLLTGVGGIFAGRLNDKIGPRLLIIGTSLLLCFGYLFMAYMQSPWELYLLYGVLAGLGFCTTDVITLSMVARWFVRRRGMFSGIVKAGTGFGQLLVPLITAHLIAAYGWRSSCLILTGGLFVILLSIAQVLRRDPQGMGLLPDGDTIDILESGAGFRDSGVSLKGAVRTRQFWVMCLAILFSFFCLMTMIIHIVPHARDQGLSPPTAAGVLSTIGGMSMLGRIIIGTANDRIGGKRSLIVCFIALLCSLAWIQLSGKPWMFFVFAAIYGFTHGSFFTVISPTVAELFGTASHGVIFGLVLFSGSIGGALGPIIAGRIFDIMGSYQICFLILTAMAVMGLLLITTLKPLDRPTRE